MAITLGPERIACYWRTCAGSGALKVAEMPGHRDRTNDEESMVSTGAWLLGALAFVVAVWLAVGWAVHSLVV